MHCALFFAFLSVLLFNVTGDVSPYNYHERVGIKKAEEIRANEIILGRTSRIIGGAEVSQDSHIFYQAGIIIILNTGWSSVCGGSLVSRTKVLTAAHCWYDGQSQARQFTIVLGSSALFTGGTRFVTTSVVTHPSWNTNDLTHDIAMVTIPQVQYTNAIQPIALPTLADINQDFTGMSGRVSGYGKTSDGWSSVCGGSLVSRTKVLTAAHCWYDGQSQARQFTIVLGSSALFTGGTRFVTTSVVTHPSWNTNDLTHDIAMVTIPQVQYTNAIQPIALPTLADINQDFTGMSGRVSGYGKTSDAQSTFPITTTLHQTTVNIISNTVCQQSYDFNIHAGHLCTSGAGGVGTCDGDSGGPLTVIYNNVRTLVGIVSFGLGDTCESTYPSVYTRVTAFIPWIEANL